MVKYYHDRVSDSFSYMFTSFFGCFCGLFLCLSLGLFKYPEVVLIMSRPTVMTDEVVSKLEHAFSMGCTDLEACMYAGIAKATFYRYQEDNEDFRDHKEVLKSNPFMLARTVLVKALQDGDVNTAHKMIDRREGSKVSLDHTSSDGSMAPTIVQLIPYAVDEDAYSEH